MTDLYRKTFKFSLKTAVLVVFVSFFSCQKNTPSGTNPDELKVPEGFPEINFPADNQFSKARWDLGKKLFFDPILSKDSTVSCASCHKPELAFADDVAFSPGIENRPGTRNAPSLGNVAYQPYLLREGSLPTLEMQVLVPIQEHNEFDNNIVDIANLLAKNPVYVAMSQAAYSRNPDPFVITRAIATFERSLLSGTSAFDNWMNGDNLALSEAEKRGMALFNSEKTNCFACHGGFNFSNYSFQNNGLYTVYQDVGRMRFTGLETDRALFKVPSLRNVGLTAPYMHDGSLQNLAAVVAHYNAGGAAHPNKSSLVKPLHLSASEMADLEAFLQSLSDFTFINDARWK